MRHLEIDWQYVEHVEPQDSERVALVRSAGRKAGRQLGWKTATMQTDPAKREDRRVVVVVTVREAPNAEGAARMSAVETALRAPVELRPCRQSERTKIIALDA